MKQEERMRLGKPIKRRINPNVFLGELYIFIKGACERLFGEDFTFCEYGADESFLSMRIARKFKKSHGSAVDKDETKNTRLKYSNKLDNLEYRCVNALNDDKKSDLAIYSFMMDALTKQANVGVICKMITKQTGKYAIIAMPDKMIYDNDLFVQELEKTFDIVERTTLRDSFVKSREVIILEKNKRDKK